MGGAAEHDAPILSLCSVPEPDFFGRLLYSFSQNLLAIMQPSRMDSYS